MDWNQTFITIIVSLLVSVFVWMLTYIVPYIWPSNLSKVFSFFIKTPCDINEISLYINQFLKYDDWRKLTAKECLKKSFQEKLIKISEYQKLKWENLCNNVMVQPAEEFLLEMKDLKEKKYVENLIKKDKNINIWSFKDVNKAFELKGDLRRYNKHFKTSEVGLILNTKTVYIDVNGNMNTQKFLKNKLNEEPPKPININETLFIFEDLIFYFDHISKTSDKKEELSSRLSFGLSNHPKSYDTLLDLMNEFKDEINSKDFEKTREKWEKWFCES